MKKLINLKTFEEFEFPVENEKLDEGLFGFNKKDFAKLNSSDEKAVGNAFSKVFTAILNNPKYGAIKRAAANIDTAKKYELLKVASEDEFKGSLRLDNAKQLAYFPSQNADKLKRSKFAGGGTDSNPSGGTSGA